MAHSVIVAARVVQNISKWLKFNSFTGPSPELWSVAAPEIAGRKSRKLHEQWCHLKGHHWASFSQILSIPISLWRVAANGSLSLLSKLGFFWNIFFRLALINSTQRNSTTVSLERERERMQANAAETCCICSAKPPFHPWSRHVWHGFPRSSSVMKEKDGILYNPLSAPLHSTLQKKMHDRVIHVIPR